MKHELELSTSFYIVYLFSEAFGFFSFTFVGKVPSDLYAFTFFWHLKALRFCYDDMTASFSREDRAPF